MRGAFTRRAFFGGTAALAATAHLPAGESGRPPLADEPPLPPGVYKRLGSARFRELTEDFRFTPDSRHLVQFDTNGRCLGYEVATGRRFGWLIPPVPRVGLAGFAVPVPTNGEMVLIDPDGTDADDQPAPLARYDLLTGRELKTPKLPKGTHFIPTPDGAGVIGYDDGPKAGILWRIDLRTGKTVWKRKWRVDASVPAVLGEVMGKWLVLVGRKRLELFDPLTGEPGPKLEESPPKDAPPDHHFNPLNFSADGRRVAACFSERHPGQVVVWDVPTGRVVGRNSFEVDQPTVALSPDGACLLTPPWQSDGQLVGMDVKTGRTVRSYPVTNVGQFLLSPDGKVLVAPHGSAEGQVFNGRVNFAFDSAGPVRLLDAATGLPLPQSPDPQADLTSLRFAGPLTLHTDLHTAAETRPTLVWDTRTGRRLAIPHPARAYPPQHAIPEFTLSPEGTRHLFTHDDELLVADAFSRRKLHAFRMPTDGGFKAVWLTRSVVARMDLTALHVCDLATRRRRSLPVPFKEDAKLKKVAASADGKTVTTTWTTGDPAKGFVTWIDTADGTTTTRPLSEHSRLATSADGRRVAANPIREDGFEHLFVFDRDGRSFHLPTLRGTSLPFDLSACGRTLIALDVSYVSDDEEHGYWQLWVQLVEVASGELRAAFPIPGPAQEAAQAQRPRLTDRVAASPCGRRFATVSREAPVYLWDMYGEESDPKPKPDKAGLLAAWDALAGTADKAFAAVRLLVQHPAEAVRLLKEKLPPAVAIKPEWVRERVVRLGSEDYATRSAAERELSAVADRIAEQLKEAEADTPEGDERLERIRGRAGRLTRDRLREVRAVEVLEYAGADALLKSLAVGADCILTREAKTAVARRGG